MPRNAAASFLAILFFPLAGALPAQGRTLVHEAIVPAPAETIWEAFTDPAEMVRWMGVARAEMDLRIGGLWKTNNRPDEEIGGPGTIVHEILSFEPNRMLTTRCRRVPDGSGLDLFEETWFVLRLEPLGADRTRVVATLLGWGEGEEWNRVYAHFERGNAVTLQRLVKHFGGEGTGRESKAAEPSWRSYLAHVAAAEASLRLGEVGAARRWLEAAPAEHRGWEWRRIAAESDRSARALRAHDGAVQAVAYSPDGSLLATGSADRTVKIWNARTLEALRTLEGHDREIHCVTWSPDGTLLASSSGDATARIWRAETGECVTVFRNHTYPVSAVRFSPDGKTVASTSYHRPEGGEIRLWTPQTGEETALLRHGYAPITCVAWRPDGRGLFAASWDQTLKLWDLEKPAEPLVIPLGAEGTYRAANALALSPDGSLLAVGGKDDEVHLYQAGSGEHRADLAGHDGWVEDLSFSPDGALLASASVDASIALWDPRTGSLLARLVGHTSSVRGLSFSRDGRTLASGSDDGTVRFWDVASMRRAQESIEFEPGSENTAYYACESPDGALLAVAFHGGRAALLSTADGSEVRALEHEGWINWLDFAPDGRRLLAAGESGLFVWNPSSGEKLLSIDATKEVECAVFSPDGSRIASGSRDGTARVFDAATGEQIFSLPHGNVVRSVTFSPDGALLATAAARDPLVRGFDARSGQPRLALEGHAVAADSVAFLPGGKRLVTADLAGVLRLWRLEDGALLGARRGHDGAISSLCVHPDGSRIATGGEDEVAVLWDPDTLEPLSRVVDRDGIYALSFSRDGSRLVVVPLSNRVRILDTVPMRDRLSVRAGPKTQPSARGRARCRGARSVDEAY
jgi:WD40 repeat protein